MVERRYPALIRGIHRLLSRSSLTPSPPPPPLLPQSTAMSLFWSFISRSPSPRMISSLPPSLLLCYIALIWASGPWITSGITDWEASRSISVCLSWHSSSLCHSMAPPHPSLSHKHICIHTRMLRYLVLFPFPSCHLISHTTTTTSSSSSSTTPSSSSSLLISLRLFGHVLSCHSSFSSVSLSLSPSSLWHPISPSISLVVLFLPPLTLSLHTCLSRFAFARHDNHWNNDAESESRLSWMINLLRRRKQIYHPLRVTALAKQAPCTHAGSRNREGGNIYMWSRGTETQSSGAFQGQAAGSACSNGNLNHHLKTSQLTVEKRMRNWPLLPFATEVKQRRKKERKFILSIWGKKGKGKVEGWGEEEEGGGTQYMHQQLIRYKTERDRNRSSLLDGAQSFFFYIAVCAKKKKKTTKNTHVTHVCTLHR